MHGLFLHCRPGFEGECAAEIQARAAEHGINGYCKAKPASAYVVFVVPQADAAARLQQALSFDQLIFTRQWFRILALETALDMQDRVGGLLAALAADPPRVAEVFLETVDTNAGKELEALCRKLARPLRAALEDRGMLDPAASDTRLHVCFLATSAAYAGVALTVNSSTHRMGIPRLKFPRGAPSRSTLKLEEALLTFLTADERSRHLMPGMRAVDLGAAPGGWTWQLVQRGLQVTAVDNGNLAPALLETGLVEHHREDGFRFRPDTPVDWLVCDIVEQPIRIAGLASDWLAAGWCRQAIFNLKLPMKKRFQEVERCLNLIHARLLERGLRYRVACKQLYHDREEVTVYARILSRAD